MKQKIEGYRAVVRDCDDCYDLDVCDDNWCCKSCAFKDNPCCDHVACCDFERDDKLIVYFVKEDEA